MSVQLHIGPAVGEPAISRARTLFREYVATRGVKPCVKDFEDEMATLPGRYAPPEGRLLLAFLERAGIPERDVGCVALRNFSDDACEMKRLYVRPEFRGEGAGRKLVEALIGEARVIGYPRMLLDTLPTMLQAQNLYRSLGFREISAYWNNPIPGVLFFELTLH